MITLADLLSYLSNVLTVLFAVTSMGSMGLGLTVSQIIGPLRDVRLVIKTLLASFVIVPAAAVLLARVIPLALDLQIGLLLFSLVAGAPLVPKLAQIARGNVPFAVGLTALLVAATVPYLSLVLPVLLPGAQVDALAVAQPLFLQMLLPLGVGLVVRARNEEEAASIQPTLAGIASTSLPLLLVLLLLLNLGNLLALLVTSGAIVAVALVTGVALVAGYLLGGPDVGTRRALALGTGQRNFAAAFVVGTSSFAGRPDVLIMLAAASLASVVILFTVAGEFGRRARAEARAEAGPAEEAREERGQKAA